MALYKDIFHVRFLDVDKNNVLKPVSLVNYFQEIAGEHSSSAGFGLYDIPKINFSWILLGWGIKIYKLPKWNDKVDITTWHKGGNELFSYRDYKAYVSDELIAVATSKWIAYDIKKGTITKISKEFMENFPAESEVALECDFKKIKEPLNYDLIFNYTILRHDIDTNNHLNNAKYVNLAFEAIPEELYNNKCSYIEVMYKNSAMLGEEIKCLYSKINNKEHIVTIKNKDLNKLYAIVKLEF